MDPVSNVDAIVMLLRQRLLERSRREAATSPRRTGPSADRPVAHSDALLALAGVEGVGDHQLGRALVQTVLTDHFGSEVMNAPQFQQLIDRVNGALQDDPSASQLLKKILGELRAAGR